MKYQATTDWSGSPDGCIIRHYEEGKAYPHSAIGDDLVEVALKEGWIIDLDKVDADEPQTVELTLEMVKDGMTVAEMKDALKAAGISTRAKKEDPLAKLILKHGLFGG